MTADAVPESMITWSGTRHVVAEMRPTEYGNDHLLIGVCNARYRSLGSWQHGLRAHKRDCKRCFPPAEDFGSDTLTDLERARTVAVELEQENAVLRQRIDKAQLLCIHEVANSQNYNDPRVPTLDARAVHAALSGDGTVADGAPGIRRVDADPIVGHMYLLDFEPEGVLDGEALVTFTVPNATRWVAGPHLIFRLTGDAS